MQDKTIDYLIQSNKKHSYNEICDLIQEPRYGGTQKMKQISDWSKQAEIVKIGSKYDFVRKRTAEEVESYKLQGTYMELLETLMYSYLNTLSGNSLTITIPKLMEKMYLVNKNYSYGKYNQDEVYDLILNEKLSVVDERLPTEKDINKFFISTETNYRHRIKTMLSDMEDKALITHPYEWLCFGRQKGNYTTIERATKDEYEKFLEIQTDKLKEYQIIDEHTKENRAKTKSELNKTERWLFYNYLIDKAKTVFKCSFYSYEYDIVINKKGISEHLVNNITNLQKSINNKVIEQLVKKDGCLSLIDWFINQETTVDLRQLLIEHRTN